jgi:O-antigen ligase
MGPPRRRMYRGNVLDKSYSWPIAALGVVVPVLAVSVARGLAVTLIIGAVLTGVLYWRDERWIPPVSLGAAMALAALLLWGLISALWSPPGAHSIVTVGKIAFASVAGLLLIGAAADLPQSDRRRIRLCFVAGFLTALAFLLSEIATDGFVVSWFLGRDEANPLDGMLIFNITVALFAFIIWAIAAAIGRRWHPAFLVLIVLATAVAVISIDNQTADIAFAAGIAVYAVARLWPAGVLRIVRIVVVAGVLLAPLLPPLMPQPSAAVDMMPPFSYSAIHRLSIWQFASDRIGERPLLGWGLDSSRTFQDQYAVEVPKKYVSPIPSEKKVGMLAYFKSQILPLHPHNGVLQVWLDLGLPGALATVALLLAGLRAISTARIAESGRAGLLAMFVSALLVACGSFGIWQSWWYAAIWLISAIAVATVERQPVQNP